MPTAEQFEELIESGINIEDDGFRKSARWGLETTPLGGGTAMLSFFRYEDFTREAPPQWTFRFGNRDGEHENDLHLLHRRPDEPLDEWPAALALTTRGRVGIGTVAPGSALHVAGTLQAHGRVGAVGTAPADGRWAPITGPLTGCRAFEVVAGVGDEPRSGRFALLHATALNAFHPRWDLLGRRRSIRVQRAQFLWRHRLQLRWYADPGQADPRTRRYRLEIRTRCPFAEAARIRFSVTALWFDPLMDSAADADFGPTEVPPEPPEPPEPGDA